MFNCLKHKYITFFFLISNSILYTYLCSQNYIEKTKQNKSLIAHGDVQMSGFGGKSGTEEVCGILYLEVAKS